MLTIHHVPGTRGQRIVWLCEELGHEYRIARVDFSARYRASEEWRRMNPVGKVPVITDGDLVMFESGAIVQHLLDRHGGGRLEPERGTPEHAAYLQWSWFAEATFGRMTGEIANHRRAFADGPLEDVLEEARNRARSCLAAVESGLEGRPYLVGEAFTAADIMMGYTLASFTRNVGDDFGPRVADYWSRLTARPAWRSTLAAEQAAD